MDVLTDEGCRIVDDVAERHRVSPEAIKTLLLALVAGQGRQAQFNHPELGGLGQWSQGGMIMVGDMFNQGLKHKVDVLCNELAGQIRAASVVTRLPSAIQSQSQGSGDTASLVVPEAPVPAERWPAELGTPASVGSQNDLAYAVFPAARRLAIERAGHVTVYDTLDHQIGGVSQQQSRGQSLTLTSQHGLVRIDDLPVVSATTPERFAPALAATTSHGTERGPRLPPEAPAALIADGDIFAKIERLADLRQKNILTEVEFEAKKAELLSRL